MRCWYPHQQQVICIHLAIKSCTWLRSTMVYKSTVLLACPQKGLLASPYQTATAKMLGRKMIPREQDEVCLWPWFLPFSCTKEGMPAMLCGQTARVCIIQYLNNQQHINNSIETKDIIYDHCLLSTSVYFLTSQSSTSKHGKAKLLVASLLWRS